MFNKKFLGHLEVSPTTNQIRKVFHDRLIRICSGEDKARDIMELLDSHSEKTIKKHYQFFSEEKSAALAKELIRLVIGEKTASWPQACEEVDVDALANQLAEIIDADEDPDQGMDYNPDAEPDAWWDFGHSPPKDNPQPLASTAHIWQRVPTAQVPPHLFGECTVNTGIPSHCFQSLRSHGHLAFLPAAIRCPWTPVKVRILHTTDGLATPKAVFTSKLAIKAVLYLYRPGCRSTRLSSCHSQCRWNIFVTEACMGSQLTPRSAWAPCNLFHSDGSFSSCNMSTKTVVYHLENTLRTAIAQNPQKPFFELGVWLSEEHEANNCPRLQSTALSSEALVEPVTYFVCCLRR